MLFKGPFAQTFRLDLHVQIFDRSHLLLILIECWFNNAQYF